MSPESTNSSSNFPHPAHAGIRLAPIDNHLLRVTPLAPFGREDPSLEPFAMPMLPEQITVDCVAWLRALWRYQNVVGSWTLYLDPRARRWIPQFPPQDCTTLHTRVDLNYPQVGSPPSHWRLAGSIFTCHVTDWGELRAEIPPRDGIHFVFRPREGWMALKAFAVIAGDVTDMHAGKLIADTPRDFQYLISRTTTARPATEVDAEENDDFDPTA